MVLNMQFHSVAEVAELQRLAATADKPVYVASGDGSLKVDARSFLGLFTVDYSAPVKIYTDSFYVMRRLEMGLRNRAAAMAVPSR